VLAAQPGVLSSPEVLVAGRHLLQQVGDVVRGARHAIRYPLALSRVLVSGECVRGSRYPLVEWWRSYRNCCCSAGGGGLWVRIPRSLGVLGCMEGCSAEGRG